MRHLAVITARGGSKRIPGKNIKEFCGKPILAYSIEAALESGLYDEVMVSTDSDAIAEVARQYGATVPFMRSAKTADDHATIRDVLVEVLEEYRKRGRTFDMLSCIFPAAPFVTAGKLRQATAELDSHKDMVGIHPLVAYNVPTQQAISINEKGTMNFHYPEFRNERTQDLPMSYYDPGQYYVYRVEEFLKGPVDMERLLPIVISETEAQDVDTPTDWMMAEIKYRTFVLGEGKNHG